MRRPAALAQPVGALSLVPGDPFVAGPSADAVALAQVHHGVQAALPIRDEPHALVLTGRSSGPA